MIRMIRKQFYIHKRHQHLLRKLAQMKGVGESEIIRLASDNLGTGTAWRPTSDRSAWNEIVKAANVRMSLGITVAPYKWDRQDVYQGWKESINS